MHRWALLTPPTPTPTQLVSVRQIKETFGQFRAAVLAAQGELAERVQVNLSTTSVSPAPTDRRTSKTPRTGKVRSMLHSTYALKVQTSNHDNCLPLQQTVVAAVSQEVLVGDTDGAGFNLGVAPVTARPPVSPVAATKKLKGKNPAPRPSVR